MEDKNDFFGTDENGANEENNEVTTPDTEAGTDDKASEDTDSTYRYSYTAGTKVYAFNPDAAYGTPTPPKKKKGKTALIVCICVILCAALCAVSFGLGSMRSNKENPPVDTDDIQAGIVDTTADEQTKSDVTLSFSDTPDDETPSVSSSGMDKVAVAKKTLSSVVEISTEAMQTSSFLGQYVTKGAGSGVIISEDGFIATNHHVIDGATKITVTLSSGEQYEAQLWGYNIKNDLAVVKIEAKGLSCATFGNSDKLEIGQDVLAIGNPLGQLGGSIAPGYISGPVREITIDGNKQSLLQLSIGINPGNSGGGLFNSSSELIGIVNAKSTGESVEGIGYAIPSNIAYPILQDIINNRSTTKQAYLGITIGYNSMTGVYISKVEANSDAERAGLREGDIILYIDDTRVTSTSQFVSLIQSYYVGDSANLVIYRNRNTQTVQVSFTDYKTNSQS